jgi:hypothetical protein
MRKTSTSGFLISVPVNEDFFFKLMQKTAGIIRTAHFLYPHSRKAIKLLNYQEISVYDRDKS